MRFFFIFCQLVIFINCHGENIYINLVLRWHGCLKQCETRWCTVVYKKWYTCDLRLQLKKLIDSKLKKHGRDVIKQSVIFAPENKVSCLKQGSKKNFFSNKESWLVLLYEEFLFQLLLSLQHSNLHSH